ncbi:hypothetical protein WJX72_002280 [[Myrmecia] bisecta]|uniref:Uncharacterized protein n=1 Tax=[Myrmecia] bisecta TaxID=41462 RepID=A0AAW1Q8D1_9CHLO
MDLNLDEGVGRPSRVKREHRRALVVAPKTLLAHWVKELTLCGLSHCVYEYFGTSQAERDNALRRVMSGRGVLLTTYGMVLHNAAALCQRPRYLIRGGRDEAEEDEGKPLWDFLFCDEGHKIKNPKMQLAQRMRELPVAVRVIISGTPIQNNLMELHTLFDFACEGLLGDARTFKSTVERRIMAGNDKHATQRERETGAAQAAELRAQIAPYFLRREKKEVFKSKDSEPASGTAEGDAGSESSASSGSSAPQPQSMGRKNDLIVWLQLQPLQQRVYEAFLQSEAVKAVFNQTGTALAALTVLKKVCDHPVLLSKRAANLVASAGERIKQRQRDRDLSDFIVDDDDGSQYETGSEGSEGSEDEADRSRASSAGPADDWTEWAAGTSVEEKLLSELTKKGADASCKTSFVMGLLAELVAGGHRTLVFSQSRVMLDILQAAVEARMWRFCRIDGSVSSATERQERVQQFQTSKSIPVFLLTSQVGGLGLTLTAADRVIIVDPSWNPSVDNQSVDRAYRIGQQRDVVVYRLITCGTVEEKIYRKQVFKGALSRSGTEDGLQFRYFSQQELRDLFTIVPEDLIRSQTQQQLHSMHAGQRRTTPELDAHLAFLQALPNYTGISDHDLMFSQKDKHEGPGIASTNSFANAVPGVRQPGSARATPAQRRSAASQGRSMRVGWGPMFPPPAAAMV